MIFLMIIFLALIPVGIWMVRKPQDALEVKDIFRVQGERTYTDFAIISTQVSGVIVSAFGLGAAIFTFLEIIQ